MHQVLLFFYFQEPFNDGYSSPPSLLMLDSSKSSLASDLEMLDIIPSRDNDTIHVFYVMRNQKVANDILSNVVRTDPVPHYTTSTHFNA